MISRVKNINFATFFHFSDFHQLHDFFRISQIIEIIKNSVSFQLYDFQIFQIEKGNLGRYQ